MTTESAIHIGQSPVAGTVLNFQLMVPFERITACVTGAIEGGSTYWLNTFIPLPASSDIVADIREKGDGIWYDTEEFWTRGGGAHLEFDKPTDDDPGTRDIGRADLERGLNVMAKIASEHLSDLIRENDDATTHDVFLQCVLFGEIVFG